MLRHLRQIQARKIDECDARNWNGVVLGHLGIVEEIPGLHAHKLSNARLDVVLPSTNARAPEVLTLLEIGANGDIGDRILHAVVVIGRSE